MTTKKLEAIKTLSNALQYLSNEITKTDWTDQEYDNYYEARRILYLSQLAILLNHNSYRNQNRGASDTHK